MTRIVFATGNVHKMQEIRQILKDLPIEVVSMREAGVDIEIEENGTTFEENALIKARAVHEVTGDIVLADDSGLSVDALDGAPGIYSARYMGEDTPQEVKNAEIIRLVDESGRPRSARFTSVIAAVFEDGSEEVARGTLEGEIAKEPAGAHGFGYDPILFIPELGCTTAEISAEEKNAISHRGKSLAAMKEILIHRISNIT